MSVCLSCNSMDCIHAANTLHDKIQSGKQRALAAKLPLDTPHVFNRMQYAQECFNAGSEVESKQSSAKSDKIDTVKQIFKGENLVLLH